MTGNEPSWGEYSKLVLKELETLGKAIENLKDQIISLKSEIAQLKAQEGKVQELAKWKERIDEVASPSQIQTMKDDVDELKLFKTKSVTIFMVVQFMMGLALALTKYF